MMEEQRTNQEQQLSTQDLAYLIQEYMYQQQTEESVDQSINFVELCAGQSIFRIIMIPTDTDIKLSPRESEIVSLIAQGEPNKCIARTLNISPSTVKTYIQRIFSKLNVNTRSEMIAKIFKCGLVDSL